MMGRTFIVKGVGPNLKINGMTNSVMYKNILGIHVIQRA